MRGMAIIVVLAAWLALLPGCGPVDPVDAVTDLPDTVTFAGHIAPLVRTHCMPCHSPGHAGPFALTTYAEVRRKARTIRHVTRERFMPPWPADTGYSRFVGERVLTARQIALIGRWVEQGMPPGDTAALPPPPVVEEADGLGPPDLVVPVPGTFTIPGDGRDRFIIAKAPFALAQDTFLRAVAFVPGNRRLVHHMNGALINYPEGAKADVFAGSAFLDAEQQGGPAAFARLGLANDDGSWPPLVPSVVNYLPGLAPLVLPEGLGGLYLARKGAFLLNTVHYGPSDREAEDRSRFHLWFAPRAPERPLQELALGSTHTPVVPPLHLAPGEVRTFTTRLTVPKAISVLAVNPHMHLLGTQFTAYALRGTDTIPLVRIRDWDFRWQYSYTFRHPVVLQAGDVIVAEGSFDNTAENPDQPFDPPREVQGRDSRFMRTTDEMFQFFVIYVDHQAGDEDVKLGVSGEGRAARDRLHANAPPGE
ncbi:MAG: hypothetical protein GFGODING_00754 [Flavobacteriales bacterium]|nr:hypothetical protein [Flavobacteriales bacterium]